MGKLKQDNPFNYLILIGRIVIGSIFLLSSLSKIVDINNFVQIVYKYQMLPDQIVPYFSVLLVSIEYTTGAALIIGFYPRHAALASSILFAMFAIAIGWNLIKKNIVPCGCIDLLFYGNISLQSFTRDLILLGISITLAIFQNHKFCLSNYLIQRYNFDEKSSRKSFFSTNYFYGVCFLIFIVLFTDLLYNKISIPMFQSTKSTDRNFIANRNFGTKTDDQFNDYYFHYGENLPAFNMNNFEGNLITSNELEGNITIFCIFSPTKFSSLNASLSSINKFALMYKYKPVRFLLVYRFPGKVEEHDRGEILKIIRTKALIPVIIDHNFSISKILKIPDILCPVTIISDKENIVRLAMASAPEYLIHEVIYRILKGDI